MRAVLWAVVLGLAVTAPAFASGSGANTYTSQFGGLANANGMYFAAYGPDPDVGYGVRSLTHTRLYFNLSGGTYNGVGFMSADSRSNRKLAYQIADAYGNFIYFVNNYTYSPYDSGGARAVVSAGTWQNSGNEWHFNWWGPDGLNVGVNASNSDAGRTPEAASMGADGWGGCPNTYPSNYAWNWLYRYRYNGYWYYIPSTNNYNWGNTPTWSEYGNANNGGWINFGTTSCP
jgi:hypothetical protein